jgi:3-dehydroquinate synthase
MNDAESAKNLQTVASLCRSLVKSGIDRKSLIVAVGGGVVGDVAGFVAASLLRGIALVHVPTTVVAQVDSSIGGKTGVNLPEGKNLFGAFYPPRLCDDRPGIARTLPDREIPWRPLPKSSSTPSSRCTQMLAMLEKTLNVPPSRSHRAR